MEASERGRREGNSGVGDEELELEAAEERGMGREVKVLYVG